MSIWKYRKYLWDNSILELRNRYAGSSLGSLWNIIQPLLQILVYTFVFLKLWQPNYQVLSQLLRSQSIYVQDLFLGFRFQKLLCVVVMLLLKTQRILKVGYSRIYIFIKSCFNINYSIVYFYVYFICSCIFLGGTITYLWLLVPIVLILLALMGLGLTFSFACINVFFKDFGQLLNTLIQLWMWLTPIVYVKDMLPEFFSQFVVYNPLYVYIDSLHKIIVFSEFPTVYSWMQMILFSSITMIIGLLTLKNYALK